MAKVTTVRLEEELADRVEALADAMDRSKAWVIEQAITSYVNEQSWQVAVIKEALADYRSGEAKLVSHDDVIAEFEDLEAELQTRMQL